MTDYQFGKKTLHHTFCPTCGVSPFANGNMLDGTPIFAINVRCLENFDLEKLAIKTFNGRDL